MKKKGKNNINKVNTFLFIMMILGIFSIVFLNALFTRTKYNLEKVNLEYEQQVLKNESLEMKINELASLDKIQELATKNGFTYNNSQIKTISTNS